MVCLKMQSGALYTEYLSDDTGVGDWNEARDAFKAKWFTQHGREERIERYLAELAEEVRKSFGISDAYCQNCKHWKPEHKHNDAYGWCDFEQHCLNHRSDSCDKFEKGEHE